MKNIYCFGAAILFVGIIFSLVFAAETLTISTYYPSPYGSYGELRSQNVAIGDNYTDVTQYCWQGTGVCTNTIPTATDLVVEGNVGIGTSNPVGNMLDVASTAGAAGNSAIRARYPSGGGLLNTQFAALAHRGGFWTALYATQGAASSAAYFDGHVGIGTATPQWGLDVVGVGGWIGSSNSTQTTGGWRLGRWPASAANTWVYLSSASSVPVAYADLAVGHFWAGGAQRWDLAEFTPVKAGQKLEPGDVVVIDREAGLRVERSSKAYDKAVYGIVSSVEQAAMVIGGDVNPGEPGKINKEKLPIALIGRVKAKVSAENGAIQPGDLLTTSATPGHLMKCDDPAKCFGAVAAKALESFEKGKGRITVLVTLQ
jgi:hypothetical protein